MVIQVKGEPELEGPFDVKRSRRVARFAERLRAVVTAVWLAPVHAYRRFVSPALPPRCKYHPSCSQYAVDAVRELGVLRGSIVAAWRLARCNPWSNGGVDPIEARTLFQPHPEPHPPARPRELAR
jgi:putative membrane protein insertion efficiency factor